MIFLNAVFPPIFLNNLVMRSGDNYKNPSLQNNFKFESDGIPWKCEKETSITTDC